MRTNTKNVNHIQPDVILIRDCPLCGFQGSYIVIQSDSPAEQLQLSSHCGFCRTVIQDHSCHADPDNGNFSFQFIHKQIFSTEKETLPLSSYEHSLYSPDKNDHSVLAETGHVDQHYPQKFLYTGPVQCLSENTSMSSKSTEYQRPSRTIKKVSPQGRSHVRAQRVLEVDEHGKMRRTPFADFCNSPTSDMGLKSSMLFRTTPLLKSDRASRAPPQCRSHVIRLFSSKR